MPADLNLLRVLDVLLQESSVTVAAQRLGSSPPAISRALARLRRVTGDPLLVRAGQGLVPTQRAVEIRDTLSALLTQADQLLVPGAQFDPAELRRTFTVQASDLFLTGLAVPLLEAAHNAAPQVTVVFLPETLEGTAALRRGEVDLELGVLGHLDPETRHEPVMTLPMTGIARVDHPIFGGPIDAVRFAAAQHIGVSRRGRLRGPIDDALARLGLTRHIAAVVPSHTSAMQMASSTDLLTVTAGDPAAGSAHHMGLRSFQIPLPLPDLDVGIAWHPRNDADPAHRWFRRLLASTVVDCSAFTKPPCQR
ncbi:LysR family transcriptional regulator (plasmid) [Mycolicibacterium psychrotolerans]|uniref:LysR family transcriptional regulator n=1 Tax=Mycolicibacterium psychrotolerans TaxID=216929 RepID=UPI003D673C9E